MLHSTKPYFKYTFFSIKISLKGGADTEAWTGTNELSYLVEKTKIKNIINVIVRKRILKGGLGLLGWQKSLNTYFTISNWVHKA